MANTTSSEDRRQQLEVELADCHLALRSDASDVGDWKVCKSYEYQLVGEEIPYDVNELHAQRQALRDRIKEIEEELKALG